MTAPARPEIAVAVAAGPRPLRLRWLLNALEEQEGAAFEVVVARRPGTGGEAAWDHPLLDGERGRVVDVPAGTEAAALDAAWRAASAPLAAFMDEHVRPPAGWLAHAVGGARAGAVLAGRLEPDPLERSLLFAPFHRTREVVPGSPLAPAAGTVWPREVLEALGGLDPGAPTADLAGADLLARARRAGVAVRADADLALYDAVLPGDAGRVLADGRLAWLLRRHPGLRAALPLRAFRSRSHAGLALALAGAALARRRPAALALGLPWAAATARGLPAREVPGRLARRAVRDGVEMAALAAGSVRYGAPVL
jgi:hypothetical protein